LVGFGVRGGRFLGYRDELGPTIGVHGILIKNAEDLDIDRPYLMNFGGHGIGVVPNSTEYSSDVSIQHARVIRCGSEWVDVPGGVYQSLASSYQEHKPAVRLEQVQDFDFSENHILAGLGDNTHFKNVIDGRANDNRIVDARMGGWFCETATRLQGSGNTILRSGSRGLTLEEGSTGCTFAGGTIAYSGRENIWCNGSPRNVFNSMVLIYGGNLKMSGGTAGNFANYNVRFSATSPTNLDCSGNLMGFCTLLTDSDYAAEAIMVENSAGANMTGTLLLYNVLAGTRPTISDVGGNAVIVRARSAGHFLPISNAAPADADLRASEAQFYLDVSSGDFMVKGKNSGGTVYTKKLSP
jgi:hypothetical protein